MNCFYIVCAYICKVFSNDVNVLFLPGFVPSLSKGGVRVMLRGIFGAGRVRLCVPGGFLKAACPGKRPCSGRARAVYRLVRGLAKGPPRRGAFAGAPREEL